MKRLILKFFVGWVVNALAIYAASYFLNNFNYDSWQILALVSLGFGVISMFVKPILKLLSLPFLVIGPILFLVANSVILFFLGMYVQGFHTGDIRTVFFAGIIVAAVNFIVHLVIK
ncbi:MAG: phage holin family protein [Patescibacteria group bacterium]|nr:phage holin family protein [Patescibacteria group bacterium]